MVVETQPERKRAPGALELVRNFVNSVDFEDGEEDLRTPDDLRQWLSSRGLLDPQDPVDEGDLARALEVREGLRALLLANNGHELDTAAVQRLDRVAGRAALRLRFRPGAVPVLEPGAGGVDGALGRLLATVAESVADGSWPRLKACVHEKCLWAFYDSSRNRSKRWCRMDACGNVEKARAFRERRRGQASDEHRR